MEAEVNGKISNHQKTHMLNAKPVMHRNRVYVRPQDSLGKWGGVGFLGDGDITDVVNVTPGFRAFACWGGMWHVPPEPLMLSILTWEMEPGPSTLSVS